MSEFTKEHYVRIVYGKHPMVLEILDEIDGLRKEVKELQEISGRTLINKINSLQADNADKLTEIHRLIKLGSTKFAEVKTDVEAFIADNDRLEATIERLIEKGNNLANHVGDRGCCSPEILWDWYKAANKWRDER